MVKIPKHDPRWLNDHTCLVCGEGVYEGYQLIQPHEGARTEAVTMPCQVCGHTMPSWVEASTLKLVVEIRDKAREWDRKHKTPFGAVWP